MGLDMYLRARTSFYNWEFNDTYKQEKIINGKIRETLGLSHLDKHDNNIEISINVAYWRKANAIHNWFVENCQDGKDECQKSYVEPEQLLALRNLCDQAYTTRDATKLPPTTGFFFGSTNIDDWYWQEILETRDKLDAILNDEALKDFDFEYQSSW